MKKFLLLLLAVGIVFGVCACGGSNNDPTEVYTDDAGRTIIKRTDSKGEVVTEISSEPVTDENGQTKPSESKDNSNTNPSTEQQTSIITAGWGDDGFTHVIPEPEIGKLDKKVLSKSGKLLTVIYTDTTYDEAESYLEAVKDAGFTESVTNMSNDDRIIYMADNSDGSYNVGIGFADGKLSIMVLRYDG